ncbi:DUF3747 domain-containing protein [Synechococcus sp. M16CYN]|uniref:DUF3747 domain-containing protein n=1 Tax=Synechococcus sp. M16CYN TaxID=3103139 RepID=UPI00324C6E70
MRKTYPQTVIGLLFVFLPSELAAQGLFKSQPLAQERFAVLAQPINKTGWKLLVLEQIKREPLCWELRTDGLIEPTLNNFNFTGICSRYLDSNNYSLRNKGTDLGTHFRLRLKQRGSTLNLHVIDPSRRRPTLIARATVPHRRRNGLVPLKLIDGWQLERRVYQGRTLNHLYFSNPGPVQTLMTSSMHRGESLSFLKSGLSSVPSMPPPVLSAPRQVTASRHHSQWLGLSSVPSMPPPVLSAPRQVTASRQRNQRLFSTEPIPIEVIPYNRQR